MILKLYELTDSYSRLLDMMDNEEVSFDDIKDTLESIEELAEEKFENIAKLMKTLEGSVKVFKEEEKRISTRRKTLENRIQSLKDYTLQSLVAMNKNSIEAGTFKIRKQKNPDNIIINEGAVIPEAFLIEKAPEIDKTALKQAVLKSGLKVKGVSKAPETYHVRIQ